MNFYKKCLPYRFSEADKTIMQNIFVPKSNLPSQVSDSTDESHSVTQDTYISPIFGQQHNVVSESPKYDTTVSCHDRPERMKRHPEYLKDYHCNFVKRSQWCNVISICALFDAHKQTT